MKIDKTFYIQIHEDGRQYPCIKIHKKEYEMLYDLASGHLSTSIGVKEELDRIEEVKKGKLKEYSFAGSDWCIITIENDLATLTSGFDEFESVKITTSALAELMSDWYKFLIKYETGQIPGVKKN